MIFNLSAVCSTLNRTVKQYGVVAAAKMLLDRIGHRLCRLHIQQIVWLPVEGLPRDDKPSERFEYRFLTNAELSRFGADPSLELDSDLTQSNRPGRNVCFAALEKDRLAAYGWYALDRIEPEHVFGVGMKLPPDVAYMYKGFTHPDFRGLRLHALAMGKALLALNQQGVRGLISTVEWTNFASLKSCDRLGYQRVGHISQWSLFGRRHCRIPKFPRQIGVELIPPETAIATPEKVVSVQQLAQPQT